MSYSGKIAKHDATILMLDENREPIIECEWDKRKKCDSFYIEMYLKQKKQIEKAIELLYWVKNAKDEFNLYNKDEKDYIDSLLGILKGDSNE